MENSLIMISFKKLKWYRLHIWNKILKAMICALNYNKIIIINLLQIKEIKRKDSLNDHLQ